MAREVTIWTVKRRVRWRRPRRWTPSDNLLLTVRRPPFVLECWFRPSFGYRPALLWRDDRGDRLAGTIFPSLADLMKKAKPREYSGEHGPSHLAPIDSKVLSAFHNVIAHCCVVRYDDGTPRQAGWLTLKTQGQSWVVQVKDPDGACSLTAIASTLDDALAMADLLLGSDDTPWEPDRFLRAQQSEKKKKA